MNTHHLHTGVEEEDATCQHEVVEVREVGEEALIHVEVVLTTHNKVGDGEDDK